MIPASAPLQMDKPGDSAMLALSCFPLESISESVEWVRLSSPQEGAAWSLGGFSTFVVIFLLGAFFLALSPLHGTEFHVDPGGDDSNPGSAAEPWETLAKANATLNPGDLVWIHGGTYTDAIRPARSGTSDAVRITYRAFGDGDVILVGFPDTGGPDEGALALGERSYVTVNGRAPGDPPTTRRIRLVPQGFVNSLGNVCGSEGVVVENIHGDCGAAGGVCGRGFGFCINFWEGDYETRFNVLRGSYLRGVSSTSQDPLDFTEDIVTIAHRAHHNLIEGNILTTCRHTSLYADWPTSHSNVIRGNRIENPQHTALSIWSAGVSLPEGARFLVEGNVLRASGGTADPDGFPGNAFQWGSDELIIRFNEITDGGAANQQSTTIGGLAGATSTSFGSPYFATDGRIYNNTVARNRGVAVGMMDFGNESVDLGRHRFVNNIFYDSLADPTGRLLAVYWDAEFDTADRYIGNLWGNPGSAADQLIFSSSKRGSANLAEAVAAWRNPEDPEFTPWHGWVNQFDAAPGFRDYGGGDLRLAVGNSYADAGAPLTRVGGGRSGLGPLPCGGGRSVLFCRGCRVSSLDGN